MFGDWQKQRLEQRRAGLFELVRGGRASVAKLNRAFKKKRAYPIILKQCRDATLFQFGAPGAFPMWVVINDRRPPSLSTESAASDNVSVGLCIPRVFFFLASIA